MRGDERGEALHARAALRTEQSTAIVAAIRAWAHQQRPLPESSLGKAISYMLGLWPGLTRFVEDPRIPLDNNATERGLRGMVVGRKNHYGSRSKRGTEVATLFYSLIESAKLCRVEPKTYLLRAARAALAPPGTITLPHVLLPACPGRANPPRRALRANARTYGQPWGGVRRRERRVARSHEV